MTISTNGTILNNTGTAGTTTVSLTTTATNDIWVLTMSVGVAAVTISGLSGGGVTTWNELVTPVSNSTEGGTLNAWWGITTSTGAHTLTYTMSGTLGTHQIQTSGQEFKSSLGSPSWAVDGTPVINNITTATTSVNFPSLTPAAAGELYFGGTAIQNSSSAGSTSGYTYQVDGFSDVNCFNASCTSSAQAPTATQTSGQYIVWGALFKESSGTPYDPCFHGQYGGYF